MTSILALSILVLVVAGTAALLEHTHRRTSGAPRLPFGADQEHDADWNRLLHDLDAERAHVS